MRIGRTWIEIVVTAFVSTLIFHIGLLLFLFLVPLQILFVRRGKKAYGIASIAVFAAIAVWNVLQFYVFASVRLDPLIMVFDLVLPLSFLAGLYLVNFPGYPWVRKTVRFLAAAVLTGVISIPVIIYFAGNEALMQAVRSQFQAVRDFLIANTGAVENTALISSLDVDTLMKWSFSFFFSIYLFGYFLVLAANWLIGTAIGSGTGFSRRSGKFLQDYRLQDRFVWVLLLPWAGNLLSLMMNLGPLRYLFWNIGLIMLFLYGMQGMGILKYFLIRSRVSRGTQFFLAVLFVFIVLIPGLNLVLLVGIPLLGVSETWVNYRKS